MYYHDRTSDGPVPASLRRCVGCHLVLRYGAVLVHKDPEYGPLVDIVPQEILW